MRMSEAIALCHKAVVLSPDTPHYQRLFEEVLGLLGELSPEIEPGDTGTAYVSLAGLEIEPGAFAEGLIAALHQRLGFMAGVGIAEGKFAARVAATIARPGTAKTVESGDEAAFLTPLPCSYRPASEAMLWRLKLLDMETIGYIAQLPLGAFQQQFGPEGKRCWELANRIGNEPPVLRRTESTITPPLHIPSPA